MKARGSWACLVVLVACAGGTPNQSEAPSSGVHPDAPEPSAGPNEPRKSESGRFVSEEAPAQPEALSAEELARVNANCFQGAPRKLENFGETQIIARREYALEHSTERKIPLWVCEHMEKSELKVRTAKRQVSCQCSTDKINLMKFLPDPELEEGKRAELSDYAGSGYDRGHMAPSADFTERWGAMEESFYLSNMAPQEGIGFNRHIWASLEQRARDYAEQFDEAWFVTGGFWKPNETIWVIGSNEVYIPTWFYKIVIVRDQGTLRGAAFVLENKKQSNTNDWQPFVEPIDDVEAWTGLDFFPDLPSNEEAALEQARADLSQW